MNTQFPRAVVLLSAALFAASLAFPSLECQHDRASWKGYEVLMLGWLGLIGLEPRWWANLPLFFIWYWVFAAKSSAFPLLSALFCGVAAVATLFLPSPIGCPGMDTPTAAIGLAVGGYLWVSALLLAVASAVLFQSRKRHTAPNEA